MATRSKQLEELFQSFHAIKRNMTLPRISGQITPSQWMVFRLADTQKGRTVKDVAKNLGITSSAATQLIDGLVQKGLLVRENSSEDRRLVVLSLSSKAKNLVERMKRRAFQRLMKIFQVLSDEEFDQYFALNNKIVATLLVNKNINARRQ